MSSFSGNTLNLFFPQWQGSGRLELYNGAQLLHEFLCPRLSFAKISVSQAYSLLTHDNILGYHQILSQLLEASKVIQTHEPHRILTIGGDCGVEIAPVSFLNKRYDQALTVIWLDAHGDLNTPTSSPSNHFHGMPLRVLLGEGDAEIVSCTFSSLRPEQVFLVGAREFDFPEEQFIQQKKLSILPAEAINNGEFEGLLSALSKTGSDKLYVHLDLDVIEPEKFPHVACPIPKGIHISRLKNLLARLNHSFDIVGCSVLEFLPVGAKQQAVLDVIQLLDSINLPLLPRI